MNILTVEHLSVKYATAHSTITSVDDVSFEIKSGETLGLAGESGSGKSTVAKAIMRILQAPGFIAGGTVDLCGDNLFRLSPERLRALRWSKVAMVFQSALDSLNPVMRIRNQFNDLALAKLNRRFTPEELGELLQLVDLPLTVLGAYPHQLSGGMRQRVGIALALSLKPKLLILDEPTTALDVVVQRHILQRLLEAQKTLGFSILFITHDLPVLMAISHRIAIMKNGQLCEVDTPDQLRTNPRHPYTKRLLDSMGLLKKNFNDTERGTT